MEKNLKKELKNIKIIFLDIDGVLNKLNTKERTPNGYCFVEDEKIILLKKLLDETNAKVVLSSTWREGWNDFNNGLTTKDSEDFLLLKNKLEEFDIILYDYTPCPNISNRGTRILEWLNDKYENIDSILILDDLNNVKPFRKFLIQTSITKGLEEKHIKKGIEILNNCNFKEWVANKEIFNQNKIENEL